MQTSLLVRPGRERPEMDVRGPLVGQRGDAHLAEQVVPVRRGRCAHETEVVSAEAR